jgi:hypothetical protein
MMNRRNFIKLSAAGAGGALLLSPGVLLASDDPGASGVTYEQARAGDYVQRQAYLDQELQSGTLEFIGKLSYRESVKDYYISDFMRMGMSAQDAERLYIEGKYGETTSRPEYSFNEIGKERKVDVKVFPKPFREFIENEFGIFLFKNNAFCKSVYNGLYLDDGTTFSTGNLGQNLAHSLMSLKADYDALEKLDAEKKADPAGFAKKYSDEFFSGLKDKYARSYGLVSQYGSSGAGNQYEMFTISQFLDALSEQVPDWMQYRKPTKPYNPKNDTIPKQKPGLVA